MRPPSKDPGSPSVQVLKRLFTVARNRCAFPGCTSPLIDASGEVVGEVCHIAGRQNGPRYDVNQNNLERHGFDNLVVLCGTHHKIVDQQVEDYTVHRLRVLKREHEHATGPETDVSEAAIARLVKKLRLEGADERSMTININGPGLTYADVRDISRDIIKAEIAGLTDEARRVAEERVSTLTEDLLTRLTEKGISPAPFLDPDMQFAMLSAQRVAARNGSPLKSEVLANLLLDRVRSADLDLEKVVLNEAIDVTARLTPDHFDTLSLIFMVQNVDLGRMSTVSDFERFLEAEVAPLLRSVCRTHARFHHLQYCGCTAVGQASVTLEVSLGRRRPDLFVTNVRKASFSNIALPKRLPKGWDRRVRAVLFSRTPFAHDPPSLQAIDRRPASTHGSALPPLFVACTMSRIAATRHGAARARRRVMSDPMGPGFDAVGARSGGSRGEGEATA